MKLEKIIDQKTIQSRIKEIGNSISGHYNKDDEIIVICVLKGSFMFMSDLIRKISNNISIEFIKIKSYSGTTRGDIIHSDFKQLNLQGKKILIVEDIIDSGNTINFIITNLQKLNPIDIRIVSFLFKPDVYKFTIKIDWVAFSIEDDFVVGYGLDYNEKYRSLESLYKLVDVNEQKEK